MFKFEFHEFFSSFFSFLKKLLLAHWSSLLLLLIGVYLPLQIFGLLALELRENERGFPFDLPILVAIHTTAQPYLDAIALGLTKLGSVWTVSPIVATIALIFLFLKRWRSLSYILTTTIGSAIINRTAKEVMHRVRPQLWNSPTPELDYAFPSGHAMTSMTLVAVLVILTWGSVWSWIIFIFGSLFVLAIAWTRLYLGVHFPSDIFAGWMVSIAWAIGVSLIIKPNLTKIIPVTETAPVEETSLLPEETQLVGEE
ncbi:MAG: phosphatase PAP2 family protein [Chlorogloeopsis fritschii C42_A2020_084]|uniref:phosphatase PAP2 family protein n=1 Tax=Chlorogloeopsis fritschii TaxID=1124 RepID=UPI0019E90586|nr:phosphatase PAP2 family protein [Chlorogloeopsis fritschii]MBF2005417.1 phosphatase PAP2 family protein [Chlorogloeopsis fritschii C42_A2020_084]